MFACDKGFCHFHCHLPSDAVAEFQLRRVGGNASGRVYLPHGWRALESVGSGKVPRKEDLEALAGALGLSRDGKIADLAARIKAHLEDPDTRTALADNPRFSALYGSKRLTGRPVAVANPTSNENSTPSASTPLPTAANNMFYPQPPFFPQMQGSLPIPYPNHLHYVGPAVLSTTAPVISTSSQPLLSGHPNSLPFHYSGNSQYIFN
ncbi:uncharacterized protein EDB91DRAFT_1263691 [Suillus paluster]|uniref:uncharacterized protein n=1 Tax=Suillus paluster TaxID=48578 RepID=UPI001B882B05|nr:uncharacterized protein EDB91DRAFT_1263691 [Suillus paluster]KAG1726531.1 hypothetical protein EDB91DRAFT_1263691 [Suillus paluster]